MLLDAHGAAVRAATMAKAFMANAIAAYPGGDETDAAK